MYFHLDASDLDIEGAAAKVLEGHGGIFLDLFKGLESDEEILRSNCSKVLTIVGEKDPERIFSKWTFLTKELGDDAIESLEKFYEESQEKQRILDWVKLLSQNKNSETQRKGKEFLERREKST